MQSLKTLTTVVYALYAATFITVITCIVAIIINYVKKDDVTGTWLESHFRWQIRTFWWALVWGGIAVLLWLTILGIVFAVPLLLLVGLWVTYRVARGWLALARGKALPL